MVDNASTSLAISYQPGSGILGGERIVQSQYTFGPGDVGFVGDGGLQQGQFTLDPGTSGWWILQYDGPSGCCLGGIDLTEGGSTDALSLDFLFIDAPLDIRILVASDIGSNANEYLGTLAPSAGPTTFTIPYSAIPVAYGSGTDFESGDILNFNFTPQVEGAGFALTAISAVPEPSPGLLMGLGLAALARRRSEVRQSRR